MIRVSTRRRLLQSALCSSLALLLAPAALRAQPEAWRAATPDELRSVIPARAPVISERIETEFRTASGITDGTGHFIAGVVMITAGYSAEGKYSHYFIVQAPVWSKICNLIGKEEWITDPDYATPAARLPRLADIFAEIERWTMTKTKV